MKKFLDEHGLQTYDQKIKEYIGNNAFNPSNMQTVNETVTINRASIPTAVAISNGETGFTTGDQVYNHVLNALSGITGAMTFKGAVANAREFPNRATAKAGDVYIASGTFTISGNPTNIVIEIGDMIVFTTDGTSSVNADFKVIQANLNNAVTSSASSSSTNEVVVFNGYGGKQIKGSGYQLSTLQNKIEAIYAGDTEIEPSDGEGYEGTNVYLAKVAGTGSYNDLTNKPTVKVATGNTLTLFPEEIVDFVEIMPTTAHSSSIITDYTTNV